ncbi:hypothetical protein K2173_010401 [Erythroxylum novogranatense]|uniref:Uncharacterized protein n=1 Tax=Erythroxylum novogranatense TaxID=1862640 RepID=A0AAV8TDK0_9ROSI|nr:hypothetical protein K2173_010401 [Erythroxylum novogranatense]
MPFKQGGKAKSLKQPKADKKDYDEIDKVNIQKKKEEEKALKRSSKLRHNRRGLLEALGSRRVGRNKD